MMPKRFITSQKQYLAQRTKPLVLQEGILSKFGQDNKYRWVLQLEQMPIVLQKLHGGVTRGHLSSNIIVRKILDASYWWPMINQDVHEYCWTYD